MPDAGLGTGLDSGRARAFAAAWLPAWTGNRPHELIAFYTEDAYYSDPGAVTGIRGREALLKYFIRLLAQNPNWLWTQRGSLPVPDGFLNEWHASIPVGERRIEIDGVCIVQLRDSLIYRNQVYFDRTPLVQAIEEYRRLDNTGHRG
jgi:SnoaL-like domain